MRIKCFGVRSEGEKVKWVLMLFFKKEIRRKSWYREEDNEFSVNYV